MGQTSVFTILLDVLFSGAEAALSARTKRRAELLCGEDAAERP